MSEGKKLWAEKYNRPPETLRKRKGNTVRKIKTLKNSTAYKETRKKIQAQIKKINILRKSLKGTVAD